MLEMAHSRPLFPDLWTRGLRLAGWTVSCWILVFWRLGYLPLLDPDEAHYAQITREMSATHQWLVPLLDGKPHIDKPVLFHWLQGTAFWLLGQTEFAARMPSALAALVLMALTAWCGRRLFGRQTGNRAALLFATLPATFALSSIAIFDMVFSACLFGAFASLAVGALEERPRLQDLGFILTAAAVLTKGPVAVILLSITAALCLAHPTTRTVARRLRWLRGVFIVTAIAAPWFFWMWSRFGHTFVQLYVLDNNLWLFGRPLYRRHRHPFFYARVLLTAFLPWSLLLIGRAVDLARQSAKARNLTAGELALWIWSATVVGFFSLSWFKLNTYIYPAAPAICLLASHAWEQARESNGQHQGARASFVAASATIGAIGVMIGVFLFRLNLPVPRAAVMLPLVLIVGSAAFAVQLWRARWRPPAWGMVLIVMLLCAYATVVALGFPLLRRTRPTVDIARWAVSHTAPDVPLALYRFSRWQASLRFYAGRPIVALDTPQDLRRFLEQQPAAHCVITQRDFEDLRDAGLALRSVYRRDAVVGNEGRGFRRQQWGGVLVVTQARVGGQ